MKAKRIKLAAIALLATLGVSSFAAGIGAIAKPVQADGDTPYYNTVKIEDIVDSREDVRFIRNTNTTVSEFGYQNNATDDADATFEWAYYDDMTEYKQNVKYYVPKATEQTDMGVINLNANDYKGNFSAYGNSLTTTQLGNGAMILESTAGVEYVNTLINFNISFTNRRYDFGARFVPTSNNSIANSLNSGYSIFFNHRQNTSGSHNSTRTFIAVQKNGTTLADDTTFTADNGNSRFLTLKEFLANYNETYNDGTDVTTLNEILSQNDILNITYGAYNTDTTTKVYFKMYNVTKGLLLYENTFDTGALDTTYDGKTNADLEAAGTGLPRMVIKYQTYDTSDNTTTIDRMPVTIGGVYEPLLANGYDTTLEAGTEGNTVSTLTLPTGYTAKNPDQVLVAGENTVAATYEYKYYDTDGAVDGEETTYTKDCTITVTAEALPGYTLTLKDVNGETIGTRSVRQGESYTFEALDREKTFVAYVAGDKLFKVGESVTVNADSEATLWEADFSISEEASVRMLDNTGGYGGIRWTMNIDTADYAVIKDKVSSVSSMIIPTDLIVGGLDYSETGAEKTAIAATDFANGTADFAVTTIKHYNYNRPFTGAAVMAVDYTSGVDYVYTNEVNVSVYELALDALTAHEQAKLSNNVGLYGSANVAMLQKYINGVIDLTVTDDGTNLTVADSNGANGMQLEAGYTVTTATATKAIEGKTTVTVSITVAEGSALASLVSAGAAVPVIVRASTNANVYKAVEANATAYESGVLTITVKI